MLTAAYLLVALIVLAGYAPAKPQPAPGADRHEQAGPASSALNTGKKLKIFHVMSYHTPCEWTDTQFAGFKDALREIDVEYKVFQLDAKNRSADEWLQNAGRKALALIDAWQPDLVYTSDDEALNYVAARYDVANIPFVFSGVNKSPQDYGISRNPHITGVLESEHFVESAALFKKIVPGARKIAVVFDDAPLWQPVAQRMKARFGEIPGLEFGAWDTIRTFADYKQKLRNTKPRSTGYALSAYSRSNTTKAIMSPTGRC